MRAAQTADCKGHAHKGTSCWSTRSFFWETCGVGHDAGPGRLETSWNGLKIGVHARTGRRSRIVSSECKNKRTFKSNPMTGLGHSGNVYLLRHRQDSNLRGHCPFDILSYGLKPELSVKDDSTNIHSTKITYQNSTVDTTRDCIIDQAPIKFTLDRNCAHTKFPRIFTKGSRRDHKTPRRSAPSVDTTERETSWL